MRIATASLHGAPGVTTTGLALALILGETLGSTLLVEADQAGGSLAAELGVPASPGLVELAAVGAHRVLAEVLPPQLRRLSATVDALLAPPSSRPTVAALDVLAEPLAAMLATAPNVVVDVGRLAADSRVEPLLDAMDVLLVLTRATTADLAALFGRLDQLSEHGCALTVAVSEQGPHAADATHALAEVVDLLAGRAVVVGVLPFDPGGVRRLTSGAPPRRTGLHLAVTAILHRLQALMPVSVEQPVNMLLDEPRAALVGGES